jgi:Mycothiol maleylpyruvate isomerase N-terminal domain
MPILERSQEAERFLETLQDTGPEVVSACAGWTVHEIAAHVAATAAEITSHLVAYVEGRPIPATATFEEREPPYRALDDRALRARLEAEEATMRGATALALDVDAEAVIPWTGRRMAVAKFVPHMRNEFAIHRWDIAGDDEVSAELLAQPELTAHAVTVLGRILVARGLRHDPGAGSDFAVRLRADDAPDLRLVVESDPTGPRARLESVDSADDGADEPYLELDAAARTLFIWGRRPSPPSRMRSHMDGADLTRLQALLSGY